MMYINININNIEYTIDKKKISGKIVEESFLYLVRDNINVEDE